MKHFDGFDEISGSPARRDRRRETSTRHAVSNSILARLVHVLLLAFVLLGTMHAISAAQAQQTSTAPVADEKFQAFIKMLMIRTSRHGWSRSDAAGRRARCVDC